MLKMRWSDSFLLVLFMITVAAGQGMSQNPEQNPQSNGFRLWPGDIIELKFFFNPELNDTIQIRPDGKIALPLIGEIDVSNRPVDEVRQNIETLYIPHIKTPALTINVKTYGSQKVYVGGEVNRPGVISLLNESRFERGSDAWAGVLPALRRHKLVISLVFIFTVLSAYSTLEFALNERYDSVAKLLVKVGRENSEVPPTVQNSALFTQGVRQEDINSEVQLLTSQNIVERVVDQLGQDSFKFEPLPPKTLFQTVKYHVKKAGKWVKAQYKELLYVTNLRKRLDDREAAIVAVTESLNVEHEKDSDVISVRVGLPVSDLAVKVAGTLLDFYFDDHLRVRHIDNGKQFFDTEVAAHRAKLLEADRKRQDI